MWLFLSGPFHAEQAPGMKEKIGGLIEDGNKRIIIDMEGVTDIDESVPQMFLSLLNFVRGKGGDIQFIFKNETVTKAFSPLKSLVAIYPDAQSLPTGGLFSTLRRRSRVLTRKTGIRLSRPIAITLLVTLAGWILTLVFTIHLQNQRIRQQEFELRTVSEWKRSATVELKTLRDRLRPLEQLGIVKDVPPPQKPSP
jgi:anti-anti-sigma regulatory factor/DNA-binding HxlR family transcriptional regulator